MQHSQTGHAFLNTILFKGSKEKYLLRNMMAVHAIGIFESVNVTCINGKRYQYLPGNVTSQYAVNIIDFITSQITVYVISHIIM